MNKNNYVVIMAGGVGSRFWPLSRLQKPKQFLDILGTGKTLIQSTYERFSKEFLKENIFVVTNKLYINLVKESIPEMDDNNILGEPLARNTATCIAYAIYKIHRINPNANCVIAPSDHLILNDDEFLRNIKVGLDFTAETDNLLTLGIEPSRPDTGYGYIQYKESENNLEKKVKTFTEKPNIELAMQFLESGDYLWNAGIFLWRAEVIIEAFSKYMNELHLIFNDHKKWFNTNKEESVIADCYPTCPNISIDYGILEKADNTYVIPCSFGWSDLGTWASLYETTNKDENNNALIGHDEIITHNSKNCLVNTNGNKLVVLNSVENLVIVEDDGILLISSKDKEQEIKEIVTNLKLKSGEKFS